MMCTLTTVLCARYEFKKQVLFISVARCLSIKGGPRKLVETYFSFIGFISVFQQFIFTGSSSIASGRDLRRILVR